MRNLTVKLILAATLLTHAWPMRCAAVDGGAGSTFSVTLGWTASQTPTIAGYYLVWGLNSGDYTSTNTYPASQTSATIDGLSTNQVYFFNAAAFDSNGVVSIYAGEVVVTNASLPGSLAVFGASTNGPPAPGGGMTNTTISGNGGGITDFSSVTAANSAANFWGVPPILTMTMSNGRPNINIGGTVGALLTIEATTNVFSRDSWRPLTNIAMTNIAPVALTNQIQPQDALDLAFVPSAQTLAVNLDSSASLKYFRAVMPYDYVILAGTVLTSQGYSPRLIVVNMPGIICDDVCYLTQGSSFIHYDRANYTLQLEGSGPTIRAIASTVASSLGLDWTSASEFTYSNGVSQILATVVQTEPNSSDPVSSKTPHRRSMVIDF